MGTAERAAVAGRARAAREERAICIVLLEGGWRLVEEDERRRVEKRQEGIDAGSEINC